MATPEFVLVPLTAAHAVLDYDAVMESAELLLMWSGTSWPADDFTLAENRADLETHDREHREDLAFTYSILAPDQRTCLGCVYVTPLSTLVDANPSTLTGTTTDAAIVGFWVRQSRLADNLDARVLSALLRWFGEAWPSSTAFFSAKTTDRRQLGLMRAAGLVAAYEIEVPGRTGHFVLHEAPL